ncbi:hypothetical protein ABBQ32_011800 [Trebouxia sp. C0010 RCD-2024]
MPASTPSAALFPRVQTSSLLPAQGGVGLVEVPTQIQALQAKVVSRLLEPERLAWKAALQSQHPQAFTACLQSILLAFFFFFFFFFGAIATAAPAAPAWRQGLSASGSQVIQHLPTRQQHSISPQHQLLPTPAQAVSALGPVHVIPWDPSRPWRGPAQQPQPTAALYSQGQLWGPGHLSLGVWGWGQQPAHQLVVRQASQRLRLIQARKHGILAPGALTCQPRLLPLPGSGLTPTQVLQALESRWTASLQASPASRTRLSSDMPDSQPAWMALSRGHRQHWSQRQQQQQAQQQQQPSEQPRQRHSNRATIAWIETATTKVCDGGAGSGLWAVAF